MSPVGPLIIVCDGYNVVTNRSPDLICCICAYEIIILCTQTKNENGEGFSGVGRKLRGLLLRACHNLSSAYVIHQLRFHDGSRSHLTTSPSYRNTIIRSPNHIGFAMCVKLGLQSASTEYAIVMQHDRKFKRNIEYLTPLLSFMDIRSDIR